MPWFPEFAGAVELARRQTRAAGQADPVAQFFSALNNGDTRALEKVWPGEVVVHDPPGRGDPGAQAAAPVREPESILAVRAPRPHRDRGLHLCRDLPPQAGIAVYERGPDGLLAAARVYDDIEAPVG